MTHRSRTGGPNVRRPNRTRAKGKTDQAQRSTEGRGKEDEPDESVEEDDRPGPNDVQLLDLIRRSLLPTINSPTFSTDCQRVKSLLYDRKWLEVFTDPGLVKVYAGKWVPSRALCYRELFWYLRDVRDYILGPELQLVGGEEREEEGLGTKLEGLDLENDDNNEPDEDDAETIGRDIDRRRLASHESTIRLGSRHILSLGGGAGSELLATGAILASSQNSISHQRNHSTQDEVPAPSCKWTGIDIGPWLEVIQTFSSTLTSSRLANLEVEYLESNLLNPQDGDLTPLERIFDAQAPPGLITILFTILELFSQSRTSTIALLRSLSRLAEPGTLLLVVDSASDLGEIPVGENGRSWPVYMVLDLILGIQPGTKPHAGGKTSSQKSSPASPESTAEDEEEGTGERSPAPWELLSSSDGRWYRLPEGVGTDWPVKLENTRYWYRLYRKL